MLGIVLRVSAVFYPTRQREYRLERIYQSFGSFSFLLCHFYVNYLILIPQILFKEHIGRFILLNLVLILVVSIGLRYWHNMLAFPPPVRPRSYLPPQYIFYIRDITSMILW